MAELQMKKGENAILVTRKPGFNLPTACPICLPVFLYLKLARVPFQLDFDSNSDKVPCFQLGTSMAYYDNERGSIIECLKKDGIVDLDSDIRSVPERTYMEPLITSWLEDAVMYELWVGSDGGSAFNIYYSHLPWLIGKVLFLKQARAVKQKFEITKSTATAEIRKQQIYRSANEGYGVLSARLAEQDFLCGNRPSTLDAFLLGNVLFTLRALPETSVLRSILLQHRNLIKYAEKLNSAFVEVGPSLSSLLQLSPATSASGSVPSKWSSNTKNKSRRGQMKKEEFSWIEVASMVSMVVTNVLSIIVVMYNLHANLSVEVESESDHNYEGNKMD